MGMFASVEDFRQGDAVKIKVLSLWQPWAEAIRVGAKQIETRSWPTKYRGWLAIHAAKKPIDMMDEVWVTFAQHWVGDLSKLDFGAVICVVKLTDCRPTEALLEEIDEGEEAWGNYDDGRWGWMLDGGPVIDINPAIPLRGHQGLFDWEVPEAIAERIRKWDSGCFSGLQD
jgi:activating signal cointegrator 1